MSGLLRRVGEIHPVFRDARAGKALTLALAYAAWLAAYRILIVSFVTYFVFSTGSAGSPKLEDVTEALSTDELWIAGLGALLFMALLRIFNPQRASSGPNATSAGLKRGSPGTRGLVQGLILSFGIVGACLAAGIYRYLGFFVHFEQALLAVGNVLLRALSLAAMTFVEERLFRGRILPLLLSPSRRSGLERADRLGWEFSAALACSLLYTVIKSWQFDLGAMQSGTLALMSLALSLRAIDSPDPDSKIQWKEGAALWATLLLVFHPLLGLPVLGSEFGGVFLVKYQPAGEPTEFLRLLSGGAGGPLSGFALQILLIFDMIRTGFRHASPHGNPKPPKQSETSDD